MNKLVYKENTFDQDDIFSGNVHMGMSLRSSSLEVNTLSAEVRDTTGLLRNFTRNDPLTWFYDDAQKGIFYLQEVERIGPNRYSIYATSLIGILAEGQHYGGIYTGQTAQDVISDICGTVPFIVQGKYADTQLYGWLPVASRRDNLVQVLIAIGAWIKTDLNGVLRIESLWDGIINTIDADYMLEGAKVPETAKVTQVVVTEHQYVQGGEQTKLFEGTASQNDVITFNDPVYNLSATGFSILESGANYAKVSAGTGSLTGQKYVHNTREISMDVATATEPNIKTVKDATLVSLINSAAVAERMVNYYQWTETIQSSVIYQGELPGNRASTWHPYDLETTTACLESADISLSNTLKSNEKLVVGFIPPKFEQTITFDEHELLTGSGSWIVPEGVTELQLVLIQAGQAGQNGTSGTSGGGGGNFAQRDSNEREYPSPSTGQTVSVSASVSANGGSAGQGGTGGQGGSAGKVLQTTLEVTPGQSISYSCGVGGSSGGATGGETTFGSLTSASGGVLPAGYTDIVSGTTYALPGSSGGDGGDGGGNGSSGDSVGNVSGGSGTSSQSRTYTDRSSNSSSTTSGTFSYNHNGAGGGGAGGSSGGNNGSVGGYSRAGALTYGTGSGHGEASFSQMLGGTGGSGAAGSAGSTYGSGGNGGGGGGGGGAAGNVTVNSSITVTLRSEVIGDASVEAVAYPPRGGGGGAGGAGGSGAAGCIILFYGILTKSVSGPRKDKNGKILLDKARRLTIV